MFWSKFDVWYNIYRNKLQLTNTQMFVPLCCPKLGWTIWRMKPDWNNTCCWLSWVLTSRKTECSRILRGGDTSFFPRKQVKEVFHSMPFHTHSCRIHIVFNFNQWYIFEQFKKNMPFKLNLIINIKIISD